MNRLMFKQIWTISVDYGDSYRKTYSLRNERFGLPEKQGKVRSTVNKTEPLIQGSIHRGIL